MRGPLPFTLDRRGQVAVRNAYEVAQKQHWAIARRQLLAAGFSSPRIDRWLACGRLHLRWPGVYAWGRPELTAAGEHAAALLFTGPGSGLTGLSALWWQDLLGQRPAAIHIDAPGRSRSRTGLAVHHPARIERRLHKGLPVVALPRALLLATSSLSHDSLRLVLARADFHHLLHLQTLQAAIRGGPTGSIALRAAIDSHLPQLAACVNDFERDFVLLCEEHGLPIPDPNVRIGRYVPDMVWREPMLVVELDGRDAHTSAAQLEADATKQRWLEERGHTVIRFKWGEVYFRAGSVAARLRRQLAAG